MASALSAITLARPASFISLQQHRRAAAAAAPGVSSARRLQRCYATAEESKKGLDFTSNKNSAIGFIESDSAGQTNIFAVEPRSYVAGTKAEDALAAEGGQTTLLVAGSAAIAAVVAVSAGLVGTSLGTSSIESLIPGDDVKTLSSYASQFESELGGAPALRD